MNVLIKSSVPRRFISRIARHSLHLAYEMLLAQLCAFQSTQLIRIKPVKLAESSGEIQNRMRADT